MWFLDRMSRGGYLYNTLLNFSTKQCVFVVKFPVSKILAEVREVPTNARLASFEGTSEENLSESPRGSGALLSLTMGKCLRYRFLSGLANLLLQITFELLTKVYFLVKIGWLVLTKSG